jgi:hypothetical protein
MERFGLGETILVVNLGTEQQQAARRQERLQEVEQIGVS